MCKTFGNVLLFDNIYSYLYAILFYNATQAYIFIIIFFLLLFANSQLARRQKAETQAQKFRIEFRL